jgi:hypothetical protein
MENSYENYKQCKTCFKFIECKQVIDPYKLQPCFSYKSKQKSDHKRKGEYRHGTTRNKK